MAPMAALIRPPRRSRGYLSAIWSQSSYDLVPIQLNEEALKEIEEGAIEILRKRGFNED